MKLALGACAAIATARSVNDVNLPEVTGEYSVHSINFWAESIFDTRPADRLVGVFLMYSPRLFFLIPMILVKRLLLHHFFNFYPHDEAMVLWRASQKLDPKVLWGICIALKLLAPSSVLPRTHSAFDEVLKDQIRNIV